MEVAAGFDSIRLRSLTYTQPTITSLCLSHKFINRQGLLRVHLTFAGLRVSVARARRSRYKCKTGMHSIATYPFSALLLGIVISIAFTSGSIVVNGG